MRKLHRIILFGVRRTIPQADEILILPVRASFAHFFCYCAVLCLSFCLDGLILCRFCAVFFACLASRTFLYPDAIQRHA